MATRMPGITGGQPGFPHVVLHRKDNIPFHAIIWPAELIGVGDSFDEKMGARRPKPLVLPYDVPANEFMNLEGRKLSGSQNWAVWGLDFLERYDPDPMRYYLTVNMPETRDSDWDWEEFRQRNNNELVATWGNLANRVLSFAYKHWEGVVPDPGELREGDLALLETIREGYKTVAAHLEAVKLRAAILEAMRLASEVNKYMDTTAPWFEIKEDKAQAAKSIYTAMQAIDWLKIILAPFLPHTCEKLHQYLGYDRPIFGELVTQEVEDDLSTHTVMLYEPGESLSAGEDDLWQPGELTPGKAFNPPAPLFQKLDESADKKTKSALSKLTKDYIPRLKKYEAYQEKFGQRNSLSKTDEDATFMRMKGDSMRMPILKPGYNVQIGTENQFIVGFSVHQNPADSVELIPHLEQVEKNLGGIPGKVIADAGYGCEENYEYLERKSLEAFVKYPGFDREQGKGKRRKPNPKSQYYASNFTYDETTGEPICPEGKRLSYVETFEDKTNTGYTVTKQLYQCEHGATCPVRDLCTRALNGKRSHEYSPRLLMFKKQVSERLISEEGRSLRSQRLIEPEAVFGMIKQNMKFQRFNLRGLKKVSVEWGLVSMAHNMIKMAAP
jgi:hypothetical protein